MRTIKFIVTLLLVTAPLASTADARDVPGGAEWYLHVNVEKMRSDAASGVVYNWLRDEVFDDIRDDAGVDLDKELDAVTAFSVAGEGPVVVIDGNFSQQTRDRLMTFIAAEGDLQPLKSSGHNYYRIGDPDDGNVELKSGNIEVSMESLQDGAWLSMDIKGKLLITGTEARMQSLLDRKGRIAGSRGHDGALLVLTAETPLLQAGMNSSMIGDDGDNGWNSNILRNTEQIAFLVAAAANKLAIEAELVTTENAMAESLASVVRGLISLVAFDDSMDASAVSMLQGTRVETEGRSLKISLAVDPNLVVATLGD